MEEFFSKYLSRMGIAGNVLDLVRPWNCSIVGLAAILGYLFFSPISVVSAILVFITFFIITFGTVALNDYFDYKIDQINMPYRPLPSSKLKLRVALYTAMIAFVFSLVLSYLISFAFFTIAVLFVLFSFFYSTPPIALEKRWYLANLNLGALFIILPALAGAVLVNNSYSVGTGFWITFLSFTFLVTFMLLSKDFKDIKGDKIGGKKTATVVFGLKKTLIVSIVGTLIFYFLTTFYFYLRIQNILFLISSIFIYVVILFLQIKFFKLKDPKKIASNFGLIRSVFLIYALSLMVFIV